MFPRFDPTADSLHVDEADPTADELEFRLALAVDQKPARRQYPTWRELLPVVWCRGSRVVASPLASLPLRRRTSESHP
jgi:hypothetical protein